MPASVASAPVHRTPTKAPASRPKKAASTTGKAATNGASNGAVQHASPYTIMASRIANRVAEMAENMTFVERERYVLSLAMLAAVTTTVRYQRSPWSTMSVHPVLARVLAVVI